MKRWKTVAATCFFVLGLGSALAADDPAQYGPGKAFPFTAEEDSDGAMYVWFIYCDTGFRYEYIPASEFPHSKRFRKVQDPRDGDVAWWPGLVALYSGSKHEYMNARGFQTLRENAQPPDYYRLQLFGDEHFTPAASGGHRVSECMPHQ
jgi:hypothetical protein